jgi:hypothetical protein
LNWEVGKELGEKLVRRKLRWMLYRSGRGKIDKGGGKGGRGNLPSRGGKE